jgi:pilus assembly protein CpaB
MLESKRRAIIFISISLILALIAGFMFLQKVSELNNKLGGTTKVYVASEQIDSRVAIKPEDVETVDLPNKFFVDGSHIKDPKEITNKVSVVPLAEGEIITKSVLKDFAESGDPNNRLVGLFASEKISFDEELEDYDRVDIIVSHQFEGTPKTEIFMSDVFVSRISKNNKKKLLGVGLEVSKEDAPKLIHMQNYADSIRVLKANVGKDQPVQGAVKGDKAAEKQAEKPAEKPAEQKASNEKPAEKPAEKKPAEKKPAEKPAGEGN